MRPGAGKGTQAAILSKRLGVPAISTGDIFRENVAVGTALGAEAQSYIDRGAYVPDDLTNALIADRLAPTDTHHGFLLEDVARRALFGSAETSPESEISAPRRRGS